MGREGKGWDGMSGMYGRRIVGLLVWIWCESYGRWDGYWEGQ